MSPATLRQQPNRLQQPQFFHEKRQPVVAAQPFDPAQQLLRALTIQKPRDTEDPRHFRHVEIEEQILEHQRLRLAVPVKPSSEIAPSEARRRNVMADGNPGVVVPRIQSEAPQPYENLV